MEKLLIRPRPLKQMEKVIANWNVTSIYCMLLRKEPETTWRIWGVSGDMDLLRCPYRDRTFRWVHLSFLIRQTAYRWAELQGKPARDTEQIRASKREETVHKGGISMSTAGLSLVVYWSSSKELWSASFFYASLRGQDWRR